MGLNFLHKKAQQTLDLTKLQSQLKQAQEKKEQALLTLGERVCAMFDMDTFAAEELKDGVEAVRAAQSQIAELEKHIQEVREADEKAAPPEDSHEPPSP